MNDRHPTSIVGVAESTVAPLVRALCRDADRDDGASVGTSVGDTQRGSELGRDAIAERFARAAWSGIAEPGDRDAGYLVAVLGAEKALTALAHTPPPVGDAVDLGVLRAALSEVDHETRSVAALDVVLDDRQLADAVKRWRPRVSVPTVLLSLRQAARFGTDLLVPDDPDWPTGVDELGLSAPLALWARGDRSLLGRLQRSVAIVGARAATGYGEHVTIEAASGLVDRGFTIVSGAAYGIDGIAHRSALASAGPTVAFLAGGVDRFYPAGHEALLTRIVERGVVVSEVPCGTAPTRWRFLQRNRLIAAASRATVVVEAGWRSGSLNTASHAAQLGRPIGAVPGPVTSAASAGCHKLIRASLAMCVTGPDDIAELVDDGLFASPGEAAALGDGARGAGRDRGRAGTASDGSGSPVTSAVAHDPTGTRVRLLDALSERSGRSVDKLAVISGLAPDRVRAELGLLELEGLVRELPGGWQRYTANQLAARP